ncbi:PadR family transcriptional regulator, partial [Candidatus Woesearchaeota archaeon]|nr:PadR family transcriptional regulator [Candidatus Woesearchaeota archaeon]
RMILSIDKIRMLSDKNLEGEINNLNPEVVESLVKKELKNILISLLLSKPMCGVDLVKLLYEKFKVFISPGMLYPTLHDLEKEGLISYDYKIKNKIYKVNEKNNAELLLKNHVQVTSLLSKFLVKD